MKQPVALVLPFVGPVIAPHGAVFTLDSLNAVPDGRGTGLVNRQTLETTQVSGPIRGLSVSLVISGLGASGAFNGDLYATLQHGSGLAVLLNRPGRDAVNEWGYGDNGLAITFDDSESAPDVHAYQLTVGTPPGPLTGVWSSDARAEDPGFVTTGSPRSASLSLDSFLGLEASGEWTLFLADLELGGRARSIGPRHTTSTVIQAGGWSSAAWGWRDCRSTAPCHS
jgi:hypothetical protein